MFWGLGVDMMGSDWRNQWMANCDEKALPTQGPGSVAQHGGALNTADVELELGWKLFLEKALTLLEERRRRHVQRQINKELKYESIEQNNKELQRSHHRIQKQVIRYEANRQSLNKKRNQKKKHKRNKHKNNNK